MNLVTLHNLDTILTRLGISELSASNLGHDDNLVFHSTARPSRPASRHGSKVSAAFQHEACESAGY